MSSPSDLYRVIVTDLIGLEGLGLITTVGQLEQLGDQAFVRCGDVLHKADGWHTTKSAAMADAAEVIEARAVRLAAQAERIRLAHEEASSGVA